MAGTIVSKAFQSKLPRRSADGTSDKSKQKHCRSRAYIQTCTHRQRSIRRWVHECSFFQRLLVERKVRFAAAGSCLQELYRFSLNFAGPKGGGGWSTPPRHCTGGKTLRLRCYFHDGVGHGAYGRSEIGAQNIWVRVGQPDCSCGCLGLCCAAPTFSSSVSAAVSVGHGCWGSSGGRDAGV